MTVRNISNVLRRGFWQSFGPGLLWAAAAIGVSHLVQSTRAGAMAGFALTGVILLALILKYPFFEYGPRYAAATGMSLVEGYLRIGKWALWLYLILTIGTSVVVQAAVVLFTAFLVKAYVLELVFGLEWSVAVVGGIICAVGGLLLWIGHFRVLDITIKAILVVLAVSTLTAAFATLPRSDLSTFRLWVMEGEQTIVSFAFLLALVGWMPSAIDIAVWSSLWTLAKDKAAAVRTSVEIARLDFQIGYVGTGILAFAFIILGATVMFGSDESFSSQGTVFSTQLVDLYAKTLGGWTQPIVIVAVLTTMLSTSITVIDGFPRAIDRSIGRLRSGEAVPGRGDPAATTSMYWVSLVVLAVLTVVVLAFFVGNLTTMVDFATIMSFLTAPVLGYLNLRAVSSPEVAPEHRPGRGMRILSYVGLALLGGIAVVYVVSRFL